MKRLVNIERDVTKIKVEYQRRCALCGSMYYLEMEDFFWRGGLKIGWKCPVCESTWTESIFKVNKNKIINDGYTYEYEEVPKESVMTPFIFQNSRKLHALL